MPICSALLKYGHQNFSLEILKYCDPSDCISREGYFIKLFSPEYNIVQDPALPLMLGRKHSEETIQKLKEISHSGWFKGGENHPMYGKKTF
jgi:group I intron endonuclease